MTGYNNPEWVSCCSHVLGSVAIVRGGLVLHANFLMNKLLHLMAVLPLLVPTGLLGLVGVDHPVLHNTHRLQRLLLGLVTDLPGLLFAVFGVAVLPGTSLHLGLADLLRFKLTGRGKCWRTSRNPCVCQTCKP